MNGLGKAIRFVKKTEWGDLSETVRERALMIWTDNFGSLLAGLETPASRIAAEYSKNTWSKGKATIFANGRGCIPEGASFANATAANALDIDDCGIFTKGHPGAVIFPTALGLGEELGVTGRKVLGAVVVGYEIGIRVARCWNDFYDTYRAGGSWGAVASAAIYSYLLDLSRSKTEEALKIAEYNSPYIPIVRGVVKPGMVKHGLGFGAEEGIKAAKLAARGFTGSDSILEKEKYEDWLKDIGEDYLLEGGVVWKKYASCAWTHPALDAVKELLTERDLNLERVNSIVVKTHRLACKLGTEIPETTEEAQFNMAWPIAALLEDGEVGPLQIQTSRLSDPTLRDLARKVSVRESDELTEFYNKAVRGELGGKHAADVKITMDTGEELRSGVVESNIRYPPQGWDREKIDNKFLWLLEGVLDSDKAGDLLKTIKGVVEVEDVKGLTEKCLGIL